MLHAVIMAGGTGTRFWPESRRRRPKQLLGLGAAKAMISQTWDRVRPLVEPQQLFVVTTGDLAEAIAAELPALHPENLLLEPLGRDTAACVGFAAVTICHRDSQGLMLALPADHLIWPDESFHQAVNVGCQLLDEDPQALVTFGVPPRYPATGFGYIERGAPLSPRDGVACYRVRAFREKPDQSVAEQFVASGTHYWNCGIFLWRAARILEALQEYRPQVYAAVERIGQAQGTSEESAVLRREYQNVERISIDHAVMEKVQEVLVIEAPFQWEDVGNWEALGRFHSADGDGNIVDAEHCGLATTNCIIRGQAGTLIATLGVSNLIIVQTPDAILVADRNSQDAHKELIAMLASNGYERYL